MILSPDSHIHCVKGVRIRNYSGSHFPTFELNTERYSVSLRTQSECGKMRTKITPNTDTFYAVIVSTKKFLCKCKRSYNQSITK